MTVFIKGLQHAWSLAPKDRECTIFEFGVASGNTFLQLAKFIQDKPNVNLVGFDSFAGLPKETEGVPLPKWHVEGEHAFSINHVANRLREEKIDGFPKIRLISGFYEASLKSWEAIDALEGTDHLMFVNIDVDLHKSTLELLDYCRPLLRTGTVLYFDDWKDPTYDFDEPWGEHRAWAEWSDRHPEIECKTVLIGHNNERYLMIL